MGAMELMRTVLPGQGAAGCCWGLLDEGPAEAFGVAAQFVPTHASVSPSVTTPEACIIQCPCAQSQALSPVSATMPVHSIVPSLGQ